MSVSRLRNPLNKYRLGVQSGKAIINNTFIQVRLFAEISIQVAYNCGSRLLYRQRSAGIFLYYNPYTRTKYGDKATPLMYEDE